MSQSFDVVVIGAGPGGYVAAIRCAQLGLSVACVEREPKLGGTCLRVGCIPSKALLESSERYVEAKKHLKSHGVKVKGVSLDLGKMLGRKDKIVEGLTDGVAHLLKKNAVERLDGHGSLQGKTEAGYVVEVSGAEGAQTVTGRNVIIATGSAVADLPGVERGDRIGGSTEALSYPEVPEHLVVIGAGVIGLELGSVWSRLGAQVTVLEYAERCLPMMDSAIGKEATKIFKRQGLTLKFGVRVTGARVEGEGCVVEAEGQDPITCDRVLVAVGRRPFTDNLGLDSVGIEVDERGRIPVNGELETSVPGIFAIGDVVQGAMLAHKAEEEGIAVAERLGTGWGHVNYDAIPNVIYTDPEIATVGRSSEQLEAAGVPFKAGSFPFRANGRARALGQVDGLVKILAHAETDRVLGVHMIGPRVGELIIEAAMAMSFGASSEDIARVCHAHPTLHEVVKEAALAVDGRAIHS
ncbi:MAG: dihydrolipoyl dehydrogenase [Rickettsiales bacterium]|nr:dihydrolipoyl dehydrogenase [Rickettsiales bacterium]|tara:strand:- start:94 stop:1491 length:1398 start_codon:yes stop_codon:yes gene_type:complete